MDELNKPEYLLQTCQLPALKRSDSSAGYDSLADENYRLKICIKELLDSAHHNQQTQDKFYEIELYFLEASSYKLLIQRILIDIKRKLQLTQVELILIDPQQEIRQLISEIYGRLDYDNLVYADSIRSIKDLYSGNIKLVLSCEPEDLRKVAPGMSQSVALLPLHRANRVIGSLHLGSRDKERFHPGLAGDFLQHLGSIISVCIENSINQERHKHLSLVDLLTRAKNRRYLFQALDTEISRAMRSGNALSCLFIDIDYFKAVNDTHGHLTGDRALCRVVEVITPLLRPSDVLARFGGEEFTVLLPDCGLKQAHEIAERIRVKIASTPIENAQQEYFDLTVSIGVSYWQTGGTGLSDNESVQHHLISQADSGVYLAKQEGRNCVRISM